MPLLLPSLTTTPAKTEIKAQQLLCKKNYKNSISTIDQGSKVHNIHLLSNTDTGIIDIRKSILHIHSTTWYHVVQGYHREFLGIYNRLTEPLTHYPNLYYWDLSHEFPTWMDIVTLDIAHYLHLQHHSSPWIPGHGPSQFLIWGIPLISGGKWVGLCQLESGLHVELIIPWQNFRN